MWHQRLRGGSLNGDKQDKGSVTPRSRKEGRSAGRSVRAGQFQQELFWKLTKRVWNFIGKKLK